MRQSGLADILREQTRILHTRAEQSGIIREILHGRASVYAYALFLRNLLPAYQALEYGLEQHRHISAISSMARPELYRAEAIVADLEALYGKDWPQSLPLLAAADDYGRRIADQASESAITLVAHVYTRYLGDLNGGVILKRLLTRTLQLDQQSLSFYDFPQISDPVRFKTEYRQTLNQIDCESAEITRIITEARNAFQLNIMVSEAVQQEVNGVG